METIYDFFAKPMDPRKYGAVAIALASPDRIMEWSHGEIKKPETINYRTFKPERDGLFCAKIFGPTKDYECNCGKYKRMKHRGVICEKCGVEVIQSKVRRERMGHIQLATPVAHIWFLKSLPSKLGNILDLTLKNLEKVLYFDSYIVTNPGDTTLEKGQLLSEDKYIEARELHGYGFEAQMGAEAVQELLKDFDVEKIYKELREEIATTGSEARRKKLAKRLKVVDAFRNSGINPSWMIMNVIPVLPPDLRPLVPLEGGRFATSDLNDLYRRVINRNNRLQRLMDLRAPDIIVRNEKRMLQEAVDVLFDNGRQGKVVTGTNKRPLKSLSDTLKGKQGRFRQNLLGKRVDYSGRTVITIGPNLRLHQCGLPKKMALELFKPFVYHRLEEKGLVSTVKSAKKMVEREGPDVWDTLDEVVKEYPVMLNRAPTLHRLGIQAFEPTLIEGKAIQLHPLVCTAFNADFDGDQMAVHVPLSMEAQIEARSLMLSSNNILSPANGAPIIVPTQDIVLGIYYMTRDAGESKGDGAAFGNPEEVRVAYDSGQVDLHAKIKVRMEKGKDMVETTVGRILLWEVIPKATLLVLRHIVVNSADKAAQVEKALAGAKTDKDFKELVRKYSEGRDKMYDGNLGLLKHDEVKSVFRLSGRDVEKLTAAEPGDMIGPLTEKNKFHFFRINTKRDEPGFSVVNRVMNKGALRGVVDHVYRAMGAKTTVILSDRLKDLGYRFSTEGGLSICIGDMKIPATKWQILETARNQVEEIEVQYSEGLITQGEKYNKVVDIWAKATEDVANEMMDSMKASTDEGELGRTKGPGSNAIFMMADSGARGSRDQMRQLAGMRGLMAKPSGEIIETPITACFREGLSVLQYFISTHGARKGLADTALKTANSGYLTRRLVDVSQDCVISEIDCGTMGGVEVEPLMEGGEVIQRLGDRILGRTATEDIMDPNPEPDADPLIVAAGDEIDEAAVERIENSGIAKVRIRSALTCKSAYGICATCYGRDLAHGKKVEIGQAVGILAAQSIGEPGTQLTMRTFHIGGTASRRVEQADIRARVGGTVRYVDLNVVENAQGEYIVMDRKGGEFIIEDENGRERERCPVIYGARIKCADGAEVQAGELLALWDPFTTPILTEVEGVVKFADVVAGKTMQEKVDAVTGKASRVITEYKDADTRPRITIRTEEGKAATLPRSGAPARYPLPVEAILLVEEGASVKAGDVIAKLPRATTKTKDITGGLPRVAELFEVRKPKEVAVLSEIDGYVSISKGTKGKQKVTVTPTVGEKKEYLIARGKHISVYDGDYLRAGDPLMGGSANPQDILSIKGEVALARYLVDEVQEVYRLQGVRINDKHIEVIVRQMMRCVKVRSSGDTEFIFDERVDRGRYQRENQAVIANGGQPAVAEPLILGITKASLSTESFISAASFQETTKVLTEAAIAGAHDSLRGLKENVIMGRIIPAGTGLLKYAEIDIGLEQEEMEDETSAAARDLLELEAAAAEIADLS
ncbi:DNA-directed RNA polymerase subunit beta' [Desulfatibacillum alkenivorans DSM 16219]|uniref:DNA-directed RNA polymerase subunit beta' n=1 Tax=Desulfatibacillum alkenivorans DSM 16219 TaxID=1121393 RepID=A0A1M7AJM4_9BACT|nr:DNA-directed RNA polymerase subunit beta' [Desulfatibacillum alkenivorans DSM 16219]